MKELLRFPALYQAYQGVGGFFGARVKSIAEYLPLKAKFSDLGTFQCRLFDETVAKEFAGADYVTMIGVMHHIADDTLRELLRNIRTVLPGRDALCARAVLSAWTTRVR